MTTYITIRGDWISGGYVDDSGARTIDVCMIDGRAREFDRGFGPMQRESALLIGVDGCICRAGSLAGYGFLPNAGEIDRARRAGVEFERR